MDGNEAKTVSTDDECRSILVVMPQANLGGGAEIMLLHFLLAAREIRPTWRFPIFFLSPGPFVDVVRAHGFEVCTTLNVRLRKPWACLTALRQLRAETKRFRAGTIFSWIAYGHIFGGLVAFWSGIPTVWYQIGFASGWMDWLASRIHSDRILAVSEHVAERQRLLGARCPVVSILPGIDLKRFCSGDQQQVRLRLRLPLDARIAVLVGRLQRWKGMHTAIAAMSRVIAEVPSARLIIVGGAHEMEPEYAKELAEQVKRSGIQHAIELVGRQDNIAEWMSAADVVIHTSRGEPFGIVAVEGMACGRPLVTGNDGGVVEAVRDGIEGVHVPYENEHLLAVALIRIFREPLIGIQMGQRGISRAKCFSRERYASEICQQLDEVMANWNPC